LDDQFFAKLREIQKKERANSSLARVGDDFYKRTHRYLDSIRDIALNDPFSEESNLLKNVQRIATEICEIREHKIADAAVINIHRSYHLFQGRPQFDLVDTTPLNITEEEETLYFSFINVLKNHRRGISLDQLTTTDNEVIDDNKAIDNSNDYGIENSSSPKDNFNDSNINSNSNINDNSNNGINKTDKTDFRENQVLNRLNKIKSGKVIEDETYESIEKQIIKSKYSESDDHKTNLDKNKSIQEKTQRESQSKQQSKVQPKTQLKVQSKARIKPQSNTKVNSNDKNIIKHKSGFSSIIGNEDEQFVDLDYLNQDIDYNFDDNSHSRTNSKSTVDRIVNVMVLIFSEINSIIGVDNKVYGPFQPQDIVIMPDINAEILVKNKKGRLVKV